MSLINTKVEKNNIYTIELNNPTKRNPLSLELIKSLQKEFDNLKKNKLIKVVIIQANGPSFSAGHDLNEVRKAGKSEKKLLNLFNACSKMMLSIRYLPQPVIACIDGIAAAAGCQLVASCDLAFASKNSFFQTPGVNIGLFCSTPMVAISRKVLIKDMMYMLLSGDKISALEAEKIRLINKVFIKKHLKKEVMNIAIKITRKSNQSIKIGKEAFYKQLDMNIEKAYDYTSKVMTKNMGFNEAKEGIQAFIEKRKPNWKN
ncbi:MAG: enoyl-CoA hydratase [Pelagibacterales bacterium]|nr:enoyl-CoA hydratase [Pelagibacterales bacterium]OUU63484.1 MAG: enoyl-CoA hydratase [Alphaproteobacteria bacterium TMED62]|tara:strand:- start:5586 stop:6362 length:777 start_codon:yes stop_codon:yes gene_type:complete